MQDITIFSNCRNYCYQLVKQWDNDKDLVLFIGRNPSNRDSEKDATIRRCINFAKREGYGGLVMVNLMAYRAISTDELSEVHDPIGEDNEYWVSKSIEQCKAIIVCWGADDIIHTNYREMVALLQNTRLTTRPVLCFGFTQDGQPKHPLRLAYNAELVDYF